MNEDEKYGGLNSEPAPARLRCKRCGEYVEKDSRRKVYFELRKRGWGNSCIALETPLHFRCLRAWYGSPGGKTPATRPLPECCPPGAR